MNDCIDPRAGHSVAPLVLAVLAALCVGAVPARAQLEPQRDIETPPPPPAPVLTAPPELLSAPDPVYPEAAKAEGRQGTVVMRITIDATGAVTDVVVLQSAGADLDEAAVAAARQFKFKPAEWNGVPGPVAIDYSTGFAIDTVVEEVPLEEPPATAPAVPTAEASVNFEGLVREATTKAPLEGVEVSVEIEGKEPEELAPWTTITDTEGRFTLRGVPSGKQRVVFSLTSFETHFIVEEFSARERTEVIVYLEPRATNVFETVVRQRKAKKEVSKIALTREEVRRIPGTFGDPLRVIENLPGLARAPAIGGALIVRGANPQDSGIYFDGVPIPILYHFGGLTSVVNAEFIEEINFYPGGFGSYYGRATAGIVDVDSRRLNLERFRGAAEVDLFDSGFFLGGPIQVGNLPKVTIAAAARRSYIDALLPIVLDIVVGPDGQGIAAAPIYSDYQVKAEVEPIPGHVFSVLGFGSIDDLEVVATGVGDASFDLGVYSAFHRLVGRYDARLAPGVTNRFQPFVGLTSQDIGLGADLGEDAEGEDSGFGFGIANASQTWGVRDEVTLKPWRRGTFRAGIDYLGEKGRTALSLPLPLTFEVGGFPGAQRPPGDVLASSNTNITNETLVNAAAIYVEAEVGPYAGVTLVPGLRLENTQVQTLPQTRNGQVVEDGATAVLWNIDPRMTARVQLIPGTVVKGAVGVYRQPPAPQELHPSAGNPLLDQPRAVHLIGGIEQVLTDDINVDMQVYEIRRDMLVQQTERLAFEGEATERPLRYDNRGLGRTYGVELLLRHELSKYFFGWIAYTLSRTEIDVDEKDSNFILTQFDQTHILTMVGQANLPWGFTFGARFRLVSGSPTDANAGAVHDLDTDSFDERTLPFGSQRLPTFHQLDLRLDRKWVFDAFSMTAYIDLINAYNAPNAEAYQNDYRFREKSAIPSLPIAPILGISGEF